MAHNRLRVYYGPAEEQSVQVTEARTTQLRLDEVLPLLADAFLSQRTWLKDFADEKVTISSDLHEVLLAYQHYRRPSA